MLHRTYGLRQFLTIFDFHLQCFTESTEWALNTDVFLLLPNVFFQPEIDLFAFALNHQIPTYISWLPEHGLAYHTISAAKSVLSGILHILVVTAISEHLLIICLLKGIFHVRPPQLRYELILDTGVVLSYLKNLSFSDSSLKFLSLKNVTLLTLLSGQHVSTAHQFLISQIQTSPSLNIFNIPGLLKHSTRTKRDNLIPFYAFPHDADLCPVATINQYLTAQATLANNELHDELLCYRKSNGPTTKDTLAR